jgi:hypothetical protein
MERRYKLRSVLLNSFERVLRKHNPAGLEETDSYDQEALSILARFHEGALQCVPTQHANIVEGIALKIVQETFRFWFCSEIEPDVATKLSKELLERYLKSFPTPAVQPTEPKVGFEA